MEIIVLSPQKKSDTSPAKHSHEHEVRDSPLINVWKNLISLQLRKLLAKELGITLIHGLGAGHNVGKTPNHKY